MLLIVNTSLNSIKKYGNNLQIFKQLYLNVKHEYNANVTIFTDGSFSKGVASYAVVEKNNGSFDKVNLCFLTMGAFFELN